MAAVTYDTNKQHAWINGRQFISLERFLESKREVLQEMELLHEEVKRLRAENEAYKVLLKDKLNLD